MHAPARREMYIQLDYGGLIFGSSCNDSRNVIKHIVLEKAPRIPQYGLDTTLQYHCLSEIILAEWLCGSQKSKISGPSC